MSEDVRHVGEPAPPLGAWVANHRGTCHRRSKGHMVELSLLQGRLSDLSGQVRSCRGGKRLCLNGSDCDDGPDTVR